MFTFTVMLQLGPVKEYVKMLSENADVKFIVFAHHRVMLDSITEQLVDDNVTFIRIDGSTLAVDRPVLHLWYLCQGWADFLCGGPDIILEWALRAVHSICMTHIVMISTRPLESGLHDTYTNGIN